MLDQLGVLLQRIISLKSCSLCTAPEAVPLSLSTKERKRPLKSSLGGAIVTGHRAGILLKPDGLHKINQSICQGNKRDKEQAPGRDYMIA
jgi:hypothetical protein